MQAVVIIVAWNTCDLLEKCLNSLFAGGIISRGGEHSSSLPGDQSFRIVVVDNYSQDGSAEMVRQHFPAVQVIANARNVGFARANNQAMRASDEPYVILLNPDTEVKPGAISTLIRFMEEHPRAGVAGARLLNPDGSLQPSCHPAPTLAREAWRLSHLDAIRPYSQYRMERWDTQQPRPVDVVQGACMILRRQALDQVGLLDEDYFMYSEEVDLCFRMRRAGWDVYWAPEAQVVHYGGQSTRQVATEMFLTLYRSKILYFRKLTGPRSAGAYKLILFVTSLPRLLLAPLARLETGPRGGEHAALAHRYRLLIARLPQM